VYVKELKLTVYDYDMILTKSSESIETDYDELEGTVKINEKLRLTTCLLQMITLKQSFPRFLSCLFRVRSDISNEYMLNVFSWLGSFFSQ